MQTESLSAVDVISLDISAPFDYPCRQRSFFPGSSRKFMLPNALKHAHVREVKATYTYFSIAYPQPRHWDRFHSATASTWPGSSNGTVDHVQSRGAFSMDRW